MEILSMVSNKLDVVDFKKSKKLKFVNMISEIMIFLSTLGLSYLVRFAGYELLSLIIIGIGAIFIILAAFGLPVLIIYHLPVFILSPIFGPSIVPPPVEPMQHKKVRVNHLKTKMELKAAENYISSSTKTNYLDRINDDVLVQKTIVDVQMAYLTSSQKNIETKNVDIGEFIKELYHEVSEVLKDHKKLAPILVGVVITSYLSMIYYVFKYALRKLSHERKYKKPIKKICDEMELVLSYFEKVKKSRLAEIGIGTGLPKARIQALLKLGPFEHKNKFWCVTKGKSDDFVVEYQGGKYVV